MRPLDIVLPSLAALVLGACAMQGTDPSPTLTAQGSGSQCFRAANVTGFSDAGPDIALVNIGGRETWELTLSPGCPDVDYAMRLGIVSRGRNRICSGIDAELLIPNASGRGMQRCLVRNVRKLSPAEAAAARGQTLRP